MNESPTIEPTRTWMEVVALLCAAADRGLRERDPRAHSLSLQAQEVASSALALLPPNLDGELDDVGLPADLASASLQQLVRAAERLTRRHPIEQLPVGASRVIVTLGDLIAEAAA